MNTEELAHQHSKRLEAQRATEGAQASGASEGFPDHERSCILVHDSNCSTWRNGEGMAVSDPIPVIDVFAERRAGDRIGATQRLLNLVGFSR